MKIVIIGASGLIGAKLAKILQISGHEVISASRSTGVDVANGLGLLEALKGVEVVVDVANSSTFEEKAACEFFEKSSRNITIAEKEAGVKHHVALSIVGTDQLANYGYFHAKYVQEQLIKASGVAYTIVQATQFFEFLNSIAQSATVGQTVSLPPVAFQPIAADDVALVLANVALGAPLNNTIEIAGPERAPFPELIERYLKATQDKRTVKSDPKARYFGMEVSATTLVPGNNPRLGSTTLESWLGTEGR